MKKVLFFAVAFLLSQIVFALNVEIDGIQYDINLKTGYTEVAAKGYTGDIVIPEKIVYDGVEYTVTAIGASAFFCRDQVTSITFPETITSIGSGAFAHCHGLDSLFIPEKVTVIEKDILGDCQGLRYVSIPDGVTSIGNSAFNGCSMMDSICIPNSVTTIEDWAFANCDRLVYVEMPQSLTYVGRGAFGSCDALTSVKITDLSAWAQVYFYNDTANPLTYSKKLVVNDEEVNDLVIPDEVTSIGNYAFANCRNITSITIGDNVTSIGGSAFYACFNNTSITIGENVTSIGKNAFYGCSKTTTVTCLPRKVPSTGQESFGVYVENTVLYVPGSALSEYSSKAPWTDFKEIVALDIPKHQLTYYLDDVLYKSYTLEEGEFITPEPAPEREGYTFSGWSEIPERMPKYDVNVTGSLTLTSQKVVLDGLHYTLWMKDRTADVTGLEVADGFLGQVTIPSTVSKDGVAFEVTCIGDSAFLECEALTSVTIPESVVTIGEGAFYGCMLEQVFVKNTGTGFDERSFSPASYNHAMLYIPTGEWAKAIYHGDFWRFINIRETVTNSEDLSTKQAYTLMGAGSFDYVAYDEVNKRTTIKRAYYDVDENVPHNSWQIVKRGGKCYLYNIGAKRYAQMGTDGALKLAEEPVEMNMVNGERGVILGDDVNRQWVFVLNDKVNVAEIPDGIEDVPVLSEQDGLYYSLDGVRVEKPGHGVFIVKGKDGRTRKVVNRPSLSEGHLSR